MSCKKTENRVLWIVVSILLASIFLLTTVGIDNVNSVWEEPWVTGIFTVVGSFIGVLGGGVVSLYVYKRQTNEEFLRTNSELRIFILEYSYDLSNVTNTFISIMKDEYPNLENIRKQQVEKSAMCLLKKIENLNVSSDFIKEKNLVKVLVQNISNFVENYPNKENFKERALSDAENLIRMIEELRNRLQVNEIVRPGQPEDNI
ncbi:hypothetical protein CSV79_01665 [Sporosarcina sp. P13]|uniref:hypothetical protein n=1 Tax=Sporosarcina sp. P13 TaxID=2048263 RepID=UPI000C16B035|nr:hypothetical protein [Sporosarcina sp. P13]PIC65355.1 hypothetical protein CSV79_01665 [Sporosarcina sp. P13]